MSRSSRFIRGLLTGYASIGVNILYTIASIPLALHYLSKEEFGVWALTTQLSGYLLLLEFGMSASIARTLSDHKDDITDGMYGSVLCTGKRVFIIQGFAIIFFGSLIAWAGPVLLKLPNHIVAEFKVLMIIQATICGARLSTETLASPLWCHQRLDIRNLISSLVLIISFMALWLGFHLGWKLYSLIFATASGFAINTLSTYISCSFLKLYPPREYRGKYNPELFRELLHFGSGLFLMNLGTQLVSASQVIVVSRILGVEMAAVWAISTKMYNLSKQIVSKVLDASAGAFAELFTRGESNKLLYRFKDITKISGAISALTGAALVLLNGPFVEVWTKGIITWNPWNNYLLGALLLATSISHCHVALVGVTKSIKGMKFIKISEGIIFVTSSILLTGHYGMTGILCTAVICNILITGYYSIGRTAQHFGLSRGEVIGWGTSPIVIMVILAVLFPLLYLPVISDLNTHSKLAVRMAIYLTLVIPAVWHFCIPKNIKRDLICYLKGLYAKFKPL